MFPHASRLAVAGSIVIAFATSAGAAGNAAGPVAVPPRGNAVAASGLHKVVGTYINWGGAAGQTVVTGFNNLDTATINCANAAGCTIASAVMVQISPPAGTFWAICTVVDGTYASPGCPYQGSTADVGMYLTGNGATNIAVAVGTHVVQSQVYVSSDSTLGNWQASYTVFKP